ncbi:hypothetical protein E1B28_003859 [Marasmius oreades]|uniref:Uncharacterized protein n=1 Tax=Marasmius oreades TaxID=181124 RepID=A0A9P8ACC3_9AGAR|nr:uncharacterized protein E1B28_003859 [Marasmius oreades]KAG7096420.1 hypothetical protein E1B28_003859 [Marasmius oreades]
MLNVKLRKGDSLYYLEYQQDLRLLTPRINVKPGKNMIIFSGIEAARAKNNVMNDETVSLRSEISTVTLYKHDVEGYLHTIYLSIYLSQPSLALKVVLRNAKMTT